MKVVLFNPASSAQRKPVLPMSLLALGAMLEGRHDYEIVDGNLVRASRFGARALAPVPLDEITAALAAAIERIGAKVLAVTVMPGPQLAQAVPVCRAIKRLRPDVTIVWGGYFPSQHTDVCLESDTVDFVVRGHGEHAFVALLDTLARGGDVASLPNVAARGHDGADAAMASVPSPEDLPDYPYHRVDMSGYGRRTFMGRRTLPHHSSYGCPFFCNFCAVVNLAKGRWLAQSAARTAAVTERLVREFGADSVEFYDNNFFVDEKRTAEYAERIVPLGIGWWGEARIDTLLKFGDRTWRSMRKSGLRMVYLGAESGSTETLRRMDKGGTATAEKTLAIAARLRDHGIVPEFSFVMGNPPDPDEDIAHTIAFIRRIKRINPASEIVMYLYTPVPLAGTLYEEARASGFSFPATLDEWVSPAWQEFAQRRSTLPWLGGRAQRRIRNFERVLNAYWPTVTDAALTPVRRGVLRAAGAWRYHTGVYGLPLELRALSRLVPYQRPETSGF